ncbi:dihydrodipicolinate synthase [Thermoplasmatales archaeon BRNA1]|nr:dihydrodipicolinate synthase [Thermoplasmatales archaeon BRNA1]
MFSRSSDFRGTGTALVTPMKKDGSIDEEALRRLVDFQEENGVDMLLPCGSTGEAATLAREDHLKVISIVIDQAKRAKVVAGAGSNCTREAIDLTRNACDMGADAILSISPYYVKPTQEGIFQHYRAIAEASSKPIIVYNVPGRTGSNITAQTMLRMAEVDNILGVKEASGIMEQVQEILAGRPKDFVVLSGNDDMTFDMMCCGADGVFSVASNPLPKMVSDMVNHMKKGERDPARDLNQKLMPIFQSLFVESNPIPVKYVMAKLGYGEDVLRLPLTPLSAAGRAKLDPVLAQYGL